MSDALLTRVHRRTGGLGTDITTFGDGRVEIRWKRDYDGAWSDERWVSAPSLAAALRAVLTYEDWADSVDAAEEEASA